MKRLLIILISLAFLMLPYGCKKNVMETTTQVEQVQPKKPETLPEVTDELEIAEETEARVGVLIEEGDGSPAGYAYKLKVDNNALTLTAGVATIDLSGAAGGQAITFDIGDDGGDDSVDVGEIATSGDTNAIFTESSADKILIDLSKDWPKSDLTDDVALAADGDFGDYDVKSIDGLYGVDDDIYIDMGTQGTLTLEADTVINITAPTDLGNEDITSLDKLEGVDNAVYIDMGADTLIEVVADGRVDITTPNLRLEVDALAYLNIVTANGGATTISQTSDGTDQIIIGDGSDRVDVASDTWDVTNGVMTTVTSIAFGADAADAGAVRLSNNTNIAWEKAATGTDIVGIGVDGSDIIQIGSAGASGVTITPATTITGVLTATAAGVNITAADGQLIDFSGITHTGAADEGLVLPTWADVTPTTDQAYVAWDATGNDLKIYDGGWITISPSGAPTDAKYIVQQDDATLTADQALGALASGILYSTTSTGILTIATEAQMEATSGALFGTSKAVTDDYIWVADGTDFESVEMTGDVTINNGVMTVVDDLHAHVYSNIDATTSANWIGRVSDETGTGVWVFATAPTFTTSIAFNAGSDTIAGIQNQNLVDKTAAEVISGAWEFQDDVATAFGNDADWTILYDETTSDALEFTHAAGAGADVTFDLNDNAAASTFTITNSDATYVANLVVEGSITSTASGNSLLSLANNSGGYTATTYAMYVDAGTWKFFDTSEHDLVHEGANPNWDGTTHDFSAVTNLVLPTAAADASGEISIVTGNELQWHDGTKVITIDTTPTNDNYVLKYDTATATFTLEDDLTGGTPNWDNVGDPTTDVDIEHEAGEETAFTYVGNFSAGSQFRIEQTSPGDPTGGVLFEVKNTDANVTVFEIDDQGENLTLGYSTGNTFIFGTGTSTDYIIGLASYALGSAGVKMTGDGDGAITFLGLSAGADEDLTLNLDDTANEWTMTSSTAVTTMAIQLLTPTIALNDVTSAKTADAIIKNVAVDNDDAVLTIGVDDSEGDNTSYIELDGANDRLELKQPVLADFTVTISNDLLLGAAPASTGASTGDILMSNATGIYFEAAPANTDVTALAVNSSEVVQIAPAGASAIQLGVDTTLIGTDPDFIFDDTDGADGLIQMAAVDTTAGTLTLHVDDAGGDDVTYISLDGANTQVLLGKKLDIASLGIENVGAIADDAAFTVISATGTVTVESVVFTAGDMSSAAGSLSLTAAANDQDITFTVDNGGTDWAFKLDGSEGMVIIGDGDAFDHVLKFDASNADGTITWDEDPGEWDLAANINSSSTATFTTLTAGTSVVTPLIDGSGAIAMTIGSIDITKVTVSTDGGDDSLTIGTNADVDYGITIDSDTDDVTIGWDEDNSELEIDAPNYRFGVNADEDIVIVLDSDTNDLTLTWDEDNAAFESSADFLAPINVSSKSSAYVVGADNAQEAYGTLFIATTAMTFTLPSAVAGMAVCFASGQGRTDIITVQATTGDYIVHDGTRSANAAEYYASGGAAGDRLCIVAADTTDWYATGYQGTWTEE